MMAPNCVRMASCDSATVNSDVIASSAMAGDDDDDGKARDGHQRSPLLRPSTVTESDLGRHAHRRLLRLSVPACVRRALQQLVERQVDQCCRRRPAFVHDHLVRAAEHVFHGVEIQAPARDVWRGLVSRRELGEARSLTFCQRNHLCGDMPRASCSKRAAAPSATGIIPFA